MIDIQHTLITIIHERLPHCKIFLFGSRARGTNNSGADYDIAIDNGKKISNEAILDIKIAIDESMIPVNVDVVDLATVSESFRLAINKDLILWTPN